MHRLYTLTQIAEIIVNWFNLYDMKSYETWMIMDIRRGRRENLSDSARGGHDNVSKDLMVEEKA